MRVCILYSVAHTVPSTMHITRYISEVRRVSFVSFIMAQFVRKSLFTELDAADVPPQHIYDTLKPDLSNGEAGATATRCVPYLSIYSEQ